MQPHAARRDDDPGCNAPQRRPAAERRAARSWWTRELPWFVTLLALAAVAWFAVDRLMLDRRPIVVGILHATPVSPAAPRRGAVDAMVLACEEINQSGGLLGRPIRWVVAAAAADGSSLRRQTERLIRDEGASVVIACNTGAETSDVVPVIESADKLLIDTCVSEGLSQSLHLFRVGPLPNQRITPAIRWCHEALAARRFLIVGRDDVSSRCVHAIATDHILAIGDEVAREILVGPAGDSMSDAVAQIVDGRPDVVLCTLAGDEAADFLGRLRVAGVRAETTPVVCVSISEDDMKRMDTAVTVGHYLAGGSFQSIASASDLEFVRSFKARYGDKEATTEAIALAYEGVRLWSQAVREAQSIDGRRVRETLRHQSLEAAGGAVAVDADTQHAWRLAFVGRMRADRQVEILWTSRTAIRPVPFPITRPRSAWESMVASLRGESSPPPFDVSTRPAPHPSATSPAGERRRP